MKIKYKKDIDIALKTLSDFVKGKDKSKKYDFDTIVEVDSALMYQVYLKIIYLKGKYSFTIDGDELKKTLYSKKEFGNKGEIKKDIIKVLEKEFGIGCVF